MLSSELRNAWPSDRYFTKTLKNWAPPLDVGFAVNRGLDLLHELISLTTRPEARETKTLKVVRDRGMVESV
jgi:hypothetical protein